MQNKFRIFFFGTPELAVKFLEPLASDEDFEVVGVFTEPDRPAGRGRQLTAPPVKIFSKEKNLTLFQPDKIIDLKLKIKNLQPLAAVVVAYGQIIPQKIIDLFPKGMINVHPSLLPKYRGPDPLRSAILNGDLETGISIMKIDDKMDHGPILNQIKINLTPDDNFSSLYEKVVTLGPSFLIKNLKLYLQDKIKPCEQNHNKATFTKMIKKEDALVNWDLPTEKINRLIHAYNPKPGAYMILNNKNFKILDSKIENNKLVLLTVKIEGKKEMSFVDFMRGYKEKLPKNMIDKIKNY